MDTKIPSENKITTGSTDQIVPSGRKKKIRLYGALIAVLIIGGLGAYTLIASKALPFICPSGELSFVGQCRNDASVLTIGNDLYAGQSLTAVGGGYRAVLQADGNFVIYNQSNQAIWSSGTAGTGADRLAFQNDGNIVLYTPARVAVWSTGTGTGLALPNPLSSGRLIMQADGNLVLYDTAQALWSSAGSKPVVGLLTTASELSNGQTLPAGRELLSSTGGFRIVMQGDGNLVVYNAARKPIWNSGTSGTGSNNRLVLQSDGNLVVYTAANKAVWNSATAGTGANNRLVMQPDGNLVLYAADNKPLWSSYTGKLGAAPAATSPWAGLSLGPNPLLTLQTLKVNQGMLLLQSNGLPASNYGALMQSDGNLVIYNIATRKPIWNSGTAGTGSNNQLVLQPDGNLVIYTASGRAVWNTATFIGFQRGLSGNKLLMQADGNLVLYTPQGPSWSSFTGRLR